MVCTLTHPESGLTEGIRVKGIYSWLGVRAGGLVERGSWGVACKETLFPGSLCSQVPGCYEVSIFLSPDPPAMLEPTEHTRTEIPKM